MSRDFVNKVCATLPGSEVSDPWGGGHDAWKVGGKMFACIGSMGTGVSVKTPDIDSATMLIDLGRAIKAPYFHRSWVLVPFDRIGPEDIDEEEVRDRLETSYRLVRSKLAKKVQAGLEP
ncbi:MAG: MmcQ/YjbR family DNA-binding protein [Rhodobacteraceae bacterium]|nr:MAG: MmcQ/YjbR family DNA-binding protein [Paracoccaceae bacterium]